nr:immunoglobulin heavy chain junction region [Mus musculus]
CANYDYFDYW